MKQLTRIVTWVGYPEWGTAQQLLENGSHVYILPPQVRLFAIRKVVYDDGMTPLYATVIGFERPYQSLKKLYEENKNRRLHDAPILDVDNYLKVYEP